MGSRDAKGVRPYRDEGFACLHLQARVLYKWAMAAASPSLQEVCPVCGEGRLRMLGSIWASLALHGDFSEQPATGAVYEYAECARCHWTLRRIENGEEQPWERAVSA